MVAGGAHRFTQYAEGEGATESEDDLLLDHTVSLYRSQGRNQGQFVLYLISIARVWYPSVDYTMK